MDSQQDSSIASTTEASVTNEAFFSYAREDIEFLKDLSGALEARGVKTWVDLDGLYAGEEFWPVICKAIEGCPVFAWVISPDCAQSVYCNRELNYALGYDKRIVPILWREVASEELREEIRKRHWVEQQGGESPEDFTEKVVSAIRENPSWDREHARLLTRARDWAENDYGSAFTMRGENLRDAKRWLAKSNKIERIPTPFVLRYISGSQRAATHRRLVLAASVAATAVIASLAWFNWDLRQETQASAIVREARLFGQTDPAIGALILTELPNDPEPSGGLEAARFIASSPLPSFVGRGHEGPLTSLALDPRRPMVATASEDNKVLVWRLDGTGKPVTLEGHTAPVKSIAYSHNGAWIVTGAANGEVLLWDAERLERERGLTPHQGIVRVVKFSPDNERILSASADGIAIMDSVDRNIKPIKLRHSPERELRGADFSPDGTRVVTASDDGTVALWTGETWSKRILPAVSSAAVWSVEFSTDGGQIVAASRDGKARVWDVAALDNSPIVLPHCAEDSCSSRGLMSATFSPDGELVATASQDGTIAVWRSDRSEAFRTLVGHGR